MVVASMLKRNWKRFLDFDRFRANPYAVPEANARHNDGRLNDRAKCAGGLAQKKPTQGKPGRLLALLDGQLANGVYLESTATTSTTTLVSTESATTLAAAGTAARLGQALSRLGISENIKG